MDSVSHIRVANLLMDYVEQTCGVTFDQSGFIYGNLKPDLTGGCSRVPSSRKF